MPSPRRQRGPLGKEPRLRRGRGLEVQTPLFQLAPWSVKPEGASFARGAGPGARGWTSGACPGDVTPQAPPIRASGSTGAVWRRQHGGESLLRFRLERLSAVRVTAPRRPARPVLGEPCCAEPRVGLSVRPERGAR